MIENSSTPEKLHILVAEDSPTQAAWLAHTLTKHHYRVTLAGDGQEAIDAIRREPPDLVISDIVMPHVDGYELCRQIKDDSTTAHVLVMLATSLKDPGDVIKGLAAGADNFLNKPFDEDAVISRVRHMIAWSQIDSIVPRTDAVVVDYHKEWYEIANDPRRSIHFLVSAMREADKRNQMLEQATRAAEEAVARISELEVGLRDLIEQGAEPICIVALDGSTRYTNRAAVELFGRPAEELSVQQFPFDVGQTLSEVRVSRPDGTTRSCEMRVSTTNWYGEESLLASFWDVTADVLVRDELKSQSTTDELTGLLNRRGFFAQAEKELRAVQDPEAQSRGLALLFIDIDQMKEINDIHGHDAGDEALRVVASVLKASCRHADVIARLGGDEFVALLVDCDLHDETEVKRRIENNLQRQRQLPESELELSVSVGGAEIAPGHVDSLDTLMRQADERMYQAKSNRGRRTT